MIELHGINLEELQIRLSQTEAMISSSINDDIVLVVGNTGSGKSTLINYLQGRKLQKKHFNEIDIDQTDNVDVKSPKIGHEYSAETEFPATYSVRQNYKVCDTAGYGDTRGDVHKISAYVALNLVVKYAKNIKGIVVVVNYKAFDAGRATAIQDLLKTIRALVNGDARDSMLFAFTRTEGVSKEEILYKLNQLKNTQNIDENVRNMAGAILSRPDNIVLVNHFDQGQTADRILSVMDTPKVIPKSSFALSISQQEKAMVREVLSNIATDFLTKKSEIKHQNLAINNSRELIASSQQRIIDLQEENVKVQTDGLDIEAAITLRKTYVAESKQNFEAKEVQYESLTEEAKVRRSHYNDAKAERDAIKPTIITKQKTFCGIPLGSTQEAIWPDNYADICRQAAQALSDFQNIELELAQAKINFKHAQGQLLAAEKDLQWIQSDSDVKQIALDDILKRNNDEIAIKEREMSNEQLKLQQMEQNVVEKESAIQSNKPYYDMATRINQFMLFTKECVQQFISEYQAPEPQPQAAPSMV